MQYASEISWTDVVLSNQGLSPFMAVYCAIMDCEYVLTVSIYNCEYIFREGVTWSPPHSCELPCAMDYSHIVVVCQFPFNVLPTLCSLKL